MDFILPDDTTMELMRNEFAKLKSKENARAFAFADEQDNTPDADNLSLSENETDATEYVQGTYISALLLLLYFVKHMRYNTCYGTEIFNTDRGLEQLQRVGSIFRQLNDLG